MKNILVLNGSPRVKGNTEALTKAFIEGAQENGNKVTTFDIAKLTLNGCIACENCYSTGTACIFDDDFNKIAEALEKTDIFVIASPLYWGSFPAQLKCIIDKFYAFEVGKKDLSGKGSVLISCCESTDESEFDIISLSYDRIAQSKGWNVLGKLLVPNVAAKGDVEKTDAINKAKLLGKSI